jgi:methionyl-tRNA formyltransferase
MYILHYYQSLIFLIIRYRGASPIQYTILNDDKECGVSIIEISPLSFDSGKILYQNKRTVPKHSNYDQLCSQLAVLGGENLQTVVENLDEFRKNSIEQNMDLISYAPKFQTSDAEVRWDESNAEEIYRKFRAIGSKVSDC